MGKACTRIQGKQKMSARIRKGNKCLKVALAEFASVGIRNKQIDIYSRY